MRQRRFISSRRGNLRALVTGAAGFIGSHLADSLLERDAEVIGVDCITDYYSPALKSRNLGFLDGRIGWKYLNKRVGELSVADLDGVDVVFHLAAQPGVRSSWDEFDKYVELNLMETDRLAGTVLAAGTPTVVFASSSSVYGDLSKYPACEADNTRPRSPYGVTKLAGEKLWDAHVFANPMRVVALRFFTVYGPGQRPDMATQRLIRAAHDGGTFTLFGDGEQRRDFTFVNDVVAACIGVAESAKLRTDCVNVLNVGGSGDVSMRELVVLVESAAGRRININWAPAQVGDVRRTGADITFISNLIGWRPLTTIDAGVAMHVEFERNATFAAWRGGS